MYLILEEEVLGSRGDIVDYKLHAIHIGWLTDYEALTKMEEEFVGYKFFRVRDKCPGDIEWGFNRLTQKWEEKVE